MKICLKICGIVIVVLGAYTSFIKSIELVGTENLLEFIMAMLLGLAITFMLSLPFFALEKILKEVEAIRYETKNIFYNSDFKDRKSMLAEDAWECPKCKKIHHGSVKKCDCGQEKTS